VIWFEDSSETLKPYSSASASAYAANYPIPCQKDQPPQKALRTPHPVSSLYDIGLLATPNQFTFDDVHSLLPGCNSVDIPLDKGDHARKCAEGLHSAQWLTMEINVPFAQTLPMRKDESLEWTGTPRLRTTAQGPLFGVKHSIRATVTLVYDGADAGGDTEPAATSDLVFTLPLNFVRLRRAPPHTLLAHSQQPSPDHFSSSLPVAMPPTHPYQIPELPAYSQLFYSNGDAKYDDSIPLPLYAPSPASEPPPSDVCEEDERLPSEVLSLLTDSSSSSSNVHGDTDTRAPL
jgi:hypothetical protein